MIKQFTAILVGFCLVLMASPPVLPQMNTVVKHKSSSLPLAFVDSAKNTGTGLSVTTSTNLTVTAGDIIFQLCYTDNAPTISTSSSPSNTYGTGSIGTASLGSIQAFWILAAVGGSTSFTCNVTPTQANIGVLAYRFHPGAVTTHDTGAGQNGSSSSSTPTTGTISTSFLIAKSLTIACYRSNVGVTPTAGSIGSDSATLFADSIFGNSVECEFTLPTAFQAGIHGTFTISPSTNWVTLVESFK